MRQSYGAINRKRGIQGMRNGKSIVFLLQVFFILSLPNSAAPLHLLGSNAVRPHIDQSDKTLTVAILLFDRAEIIDFAGP